MNAAAFVIGQEIRLTVDLTDTAAWDADELHELDNPDVPAGTAGTVQALPAEDGRYGVLLHAHPDAIPVDLHADEITAA